MEEEEKAAVGFTTPRDLGYIRYEHGRFVKAKKEMERKETPAPYCCGERMEPIYRYKSCGIIYRTWICNNCHRQEKQPLYINHEAKKDGTEHEGEEQ